VPLIGGDFSARTVAIDGVINASSDVRVAGTSVKPLAGNTAAIGGGALLAFASATGTATVTGAATGMGCTATPDSDPGNDVVWACFISAADTVTVRVTALIALTPASVVYHVRVLQ
jgi:hypothetical protein